MSVTFRFFPNGYTFSDAVKNVFKKLDPNPSFGEDKGENYAQIKINEHFLTMPEEFFPSSFRREIQKELRKVTVMEGSCVPSGEGPGNNTRHRIGDVEISVTAYTDYFFIGRNITGMIRAIILAKKLKNGLNGYVSPSRFFTEDFMITKEIKNLRKNNLGLKAALDKISILANGLKTQNEILTLARESDKEVITELKTKPPKWKFWLWELKLY